MRRKGSSNRNRGGRAALSTFVKGAMVGATMTVPGVSGGTMAMMLGIYDGLIAAVSRLFSRFWTNVIFLGLFLAGGIMGMMCFAGTVLFLLERYPMPVRFFFLGAVAGGIPLMIRKAGIGKASLRAVLWVLLGGLLVFSLSRLPEGIFTAQTSGIRGAGLQLAGGILIAVALILPGISVSHMLLLLGLYEPVMGAVSGLNFLPLLPLAAGICLGTLLGARVLETAMEQHPQATYLLILGFVLASLPELAPGIPGGWELPLCILLALTGFFLLYGLTMKNKV